MLAQTHRIQWQLVEHCTLAPACMHRTRELCDIHNQPYTAISSRWAAVECSEDVDQFDCMPNCCRNFRRRSVISGQIELALHGWHKPLLTALAITCLIMPNIILGLGESGNSFCKHCTVQTRLCISARDMKFSRKRLMMPLTSSYINPEIRAPSPDR